MNDQPSAPSPSGEMVVYESPDGEKHVDVRVEHESVWLSHRDMAEVFDTTVRNTQKHVENIFACGELEEWATTKDFFVVRQEGRRRVQRKVTHYNLDAIISVGYRVNSKHAVRFRQWATRTLREHLLRGYTLNERRLTERGFDEARHTLDLLARTLKNQALVNDAGSAVLDVITRYAETWHLLLEYDEDRLTPHPDNRPAAHTLDYDDTVAAITVFKSDLMKRGEASALFGNLRGDALRGILGSIEQTMFGEPLYRSREEKAAHLLYFIVKDHPFTDGNKRIGSLLFLLYLAREGVEYQLDPRALTALTLLVAESRPDNKDLMVRLIANLLAAPTP